jgi:hypothetical protein
MGALIVCFSCFYKSTYYFHSQGREIKGVRRPRQQVSETVHTNREKLALPVAITCEVITL